MVVGIFQNREGDYDMSNKEQGLDLKKIVGVIAIILAVFCAGFLVKMYFFPNKEDVKKVQTEKKAKEDGISKSQEEIENTPQNKDTIADVDTSLKYVMPDEMKAKIDMKKFDKALRKYLEKNMLFTTDTTAESKDKTINIDYGHKTYSFYLQLNNKAHTKVCCAVEDYGKGTWSFDHFSD